MMQMYILALLLPAALCCTNYRKEADGTCADICLPSVVGVCPSALIVKGGGLAEGLCADVGYTVAAGEIDQKAGPCGTLKFSTYTKPALFSGLANLASLDPTSTQPTSDEGCRWSVKSCAPSAYCSFQYQFGDLSLNQACRLRSDDEVTCPVVSTADVDPASYFSGRWYEIAASSGFKTKFENGNKCISADYYFNSCEKNPVVVVNNGLEPDNSLNTATGKARQSGPGQFEVSFFGPFFGPYWVLHTESTSEHEYAVAIVFSCSSGSQDMWILSRTPTLPTTTSSLEELFQMARDQGIDVDALDMIETEQPDDCAYPSREELAGKPEDDEGCGFGLTGCKPKSWCSYQFKWGDLTPAQSCRLKPTDCSASPSALLSTSSSSAIPAEDDPNSTGVMVAAFGVAGAVGLAVGVTVKRRRRRSVHISQGLLGNETH